MKAFVPASLALLLNACGSLGLATPQGFDQQLATAYSVHTAVVQATTTALAAGTISTNDAESVQNMEKNARSLLDAAKTAETAGNAASASSDLALATSALSALQQYLNSNGSK